MATAVQPRADAKAQIANLAVFQSLSDDLRRELRSPVGMVHDEGSRLPENLVIDVIGRAHGKSSVTRGGLNVDL